MAAAMCLLFARLGHYALWDDEAGTALAAKGVLRTGDTSALIDHNIVAYRNGAELNSDLKFRYVPPLQVYLAVPFLWMFGEQNAFGARVAFALCGAGCIALLLWWLMRRCDDTLLLLLFTLGLATNVSFFLYSRQCRYYAPATLCSVAIAYLYLHGKSRRGALIGIAALSICLFALNYLNYAALYACLAVDYLLWGKMERRLSLSDWLWLAAPQMLLCGLILSIWNPLSKHVVNPDSGDWLTNKLTLFWWNVRDLNACEFGCLLVLVLAPFFYPITRNRWLQRAPLCVLVYVLTITLTSPQLTRETSVADVRYLVPVIPLCIVIETLTIRALPSAIFGNTSDAGKTALSSVIALLAFCTNLLNGGPLLARGFHSTIADYIHELISPPGDPYTPTASWINAHVPEKASVWAVPDYMTYPLMFHAPHAVYAWQLAQNNHEPQFAKLPPIHFQGRVPPDYIVVFGPLVQQIVPMISQWRGARYEHAATINHFWKDMHRPELFWRTFVPITNYDPNRDAIYVFKRVSPASSTQ